jgi:hypothetical protein
VPGDSREREIVIEIFRMHYIEGLGGRQIASSLNERGIRAPRGGKWSPRQVESIYENEDYTGAAIANRTTAALYHSRQSGRPKLAELDDRTIATADRIKPQVRPKDEWFTTTEPYLVDYLGDENLRQIAMAQQARRWERRLDPTWERKNRTKHPKSPYLLAGLLRAKQDGEFLVGSQSGTADHPSRHYRHKRAIRECSKGNVYNKLFNAVPLEQAVLTVLQEILLDWPELEPRLRAHVQRQIEAAGQQDDHLETKRQQRQEVADQLKLYVRMLTPKTQQDLADDIARLEAQRDTLDHEIAMLEQTAQVNQIDPAAVVATVKSKLENLATSIKSLPPNVTKQALK